MKIRICIKYIAIVFLLIAPNLPGSNLLAQNRRSQLAAETVKYDDVLDFVFREYFVGRGTTGYGVGVRYTPTRGNELQLTLMETSEGRTEVLLLTPVRDSLRDQFKAYMKRHPNARYEQVYPAMKVKKQVLPLSTAEIRSLRQEILDVIQRSVRIEKDIWPVPGRTHTWCLHCECVADSYRMNFQGVSDITLSSAISEYASGAEAPFVTWMNEKRPVFEKWAMSTSSK